MVINTSIIVEPPAKRRKTEEEVHNPMLECNLIDYFASPNQNFLTDVFLKDRVNPTVQHDRDLRQLSEMIGTEDLAQMIANSPSEMIHVWSKDKNGKIASEGIEDDAERVFQKWNDGGVALYFRAPEEIERFLCDGIQEGLSMEWMGPKFEEVSEVETFVSRKGHLTPFHTDFQHNFTFQLKGSKKWKFKPSGLVDPLRGCSPHFSDDSNHLEQYRVNKQIQPMFEWKPKDVDQNTHEIILKEGSCLFHPAGIWHSVECIEDSISINVSITAISYAELFGKAITSILFQNPEFRSPVIFGEQEHFQKCKDLFSSIPSIFQQSLKPERFVPPQFTNKKGINSIDRNKIFERNPLMTLIPKKDVFEQCVEAYSELVDGIAVENIQDFIFSYGGISGFDNVDPVVQYKISFPKDMKLLIDWIYSKEKFEYKEVPDFGLSLQLDVFLKELVDLGFIEQPT